MSRKQSNAGGDQRSREVDDKDHPDGEAGVAIERRQYLLTQKHLSMMLLQIHSPGIPFFKLERVAPRAVDVDVVARPEETS